MQKELFNIAKKYDIHSVYEYEILPGQVLPVVISESVDGGLVEDLRMLKLEKSIFLTVEDVMRGGDVFGVVLLHIASRSKCVYGEPMLTSMGYDHQKIRTSLEAHLRHFLIDLREYIVAGADPELMREKLHMIGDRIRCGLYRYLNGKKPLDYKTIGEFLKDLDHDRSSTLSGLRKMVLTGTIDLMQVHHSFLELLYKIDTMGENGIK